ncbi:glycosyltransferase family 1 protein [Gloeocapsopsis sp. IPPAS B-1203]|uniref:glycosyltransferase family 4 protein n=1 Tax=Gloeocapsopsis sp. IPPAS B-1203 TaxID=2049454 RepID=UPI000C198E72|nr:glycosyltransferase family 1 protein [Gloeocapsopsis sp. IPPAS B-1203]PIG94923.1 mannosyltransferase [Gloeocapsopsis sp. IPPAS B-1203]
MPGKLIINLSYLLSRPTGTSTYALNLIPHLQIDHTLLVNQQITAHNCYIVPSNQTAEQGWRGHIRRLSWTQFQLPQIYKKLRSHLLFSPIPEAPLYTQCRYIVNVNDLIPLHFPNRSPLTSYFRYYVPQVLKQAEHILCISQATAKDITDFFGISANKITPILLAHDVNHFRFIDLPTSNYFLYIGRHDPYKNLHRVITAFAALPCDYELWLAGPFDPRYTPALQTAAAELNISDRIKILDYVKYQDLPTIINQAIALVFPSLWEGFGLPVLEAMACGTPVITSNISSLPEVAGDAALLVDPYNTAEITAAMQAIATESGLRSHLSELSCARANNFSWAKTGQATVEVLSRYL